MLLELSVENFGIIRHISWQPAPAFNVLTGETGAGKSLIIDAIETLLGKKVGEEAIRADVDFARVEGVFKLSDSLFLKELLAGYGIEVDDNIVLTRQIGRGNRSINRANGQAVPLRFLREIGGHLIDIHGQSDYVSLNDPYVQLLLLDRYAHGEGLRSELEPAVERFYQVKRELKSLTEDAREATRHIALLNFQVDEIRKAELVEGEDLELEAERTILSNVEKLKSCSQEAHQALYGSDSSIPSATDRIGEAIKLLREIAQADPGTSELLKDAEGALYQIEEISHTLRAYQDKLEYEPGRLERVEQRLDFIRDLKRKYGDSIKDINKYADAAEEELKQISIQDDRKIQLQEEEIALKKKIGKLSHELSTLRQEAARRLANEIEKELAHLSMGQVRFQVQFSQFDTEEKVDLPNGDSFPFTRTGIDRVDFLLSTNPGESFKSLSKIASTGEASRLMLAIKSVLSKVDATPTLIFDEIDIGVGGRSGDVVGQMLSTLSRDHQVICITHLPQVAVFADTHYNVHKDVRDERTVSTVTPLSGQDRIKELSAMQGSLSEPAMESTQELMGKAESWKKANQAKSSRLL
jgi:DNA repair protein RecN (Recombination protein N)